MPENLLNKNIDDLELKKMRREVLDWIKNQENTAKKKINNNKIIFKKAVKKTPKKIAGALANSNKKIFINKKNNPPSLKKQKKTSIKLYKIIILIILIILFAGALTTVGIYKFNWRSYPIRQITKFIPYPALSVNNSVVSYYDYLLNFKALNYANKLNYNNTTLLKELVLNKIVRDEIIESMAKQYNIVIAGEDIKSVLNNLANGENISTYSKKNYNLNKSEFIKVIAKPAIAEVKLKNFLTPDNAIKKIAEEKIDIIKQNFNDIANIPKIDNSIIVQDIGYLSKSQLSEQLQSKIINLNLTDLPLIIKNEEDYAFYVIEQILLQDGADSRNYKIEDIDGVKLTKIFIDLNKIIDNLIINEINKSKIKFFIN